MVGISILSDGTAVEGADLGASVVAVLLAACCHLQNWTSVHFSDAGPLLEGLMADSAPRDCVTHGLYILHSIIVAVVEDMGESGESKSLCIGMDSVGYLWEACRNHIHSLYHK